MPSRFKVVTLPGVDAQVFEIVRFIARDSPQAAADFILQFEKQVASLEQHPLRGSLVRDPLIQGMGYRQLFLGEYRTIYRVLNDEVIIVDLLHGARLLPEDLKTKLK